VKARFFVSLGFLLCISAGAEVVYRNPVVAGDYPDPSVIRVGKEFWATATSSEWGPQFPLLHSRDLVNWELTGTVFPHRPEWAVANFWAPEISEFKGHYFIYYVGRKAGGPLAVAVATAEKPNGPYKDHGPLVAQDAGSIDPVPVTDENGERYLIWKEDGNSRRLPCILWAQKLSNDGTMLVGNRTEVLRNDGPWEGAVIEGPFVVRKGDWFYLFYSGSGCCGRGCNYALGVARSHKLLGPWEKNPANPLLAGNDDWKCPGHGSIVDDGNGRYWLLYHSYSANSFIFTGREALLDEVKFGNEGWPTINDGHPSDQATSPLGVVQKPPQPFVDKFAGEHLEAGWQWPQNLEPKYKIANGHLSLTPATESTDKFLGAILARSTIAGDYTAETVVSQKALRQSDVVGLAAIGDTENATGLALRNGKLVLWRRDKGKHQEWESNDSPRHENIYLRLTATKGYVFKFASSSDGKSWTPIGPEQQGAQMPPWDRSIRVGLTVGGSQNTTGVFESFTMTR